MFSTILFRNLNVKRLIANARRYSSSEENVIVVGNIGEIRTIGINRPDKRNCINLKTAKLLTREIENFENDESSLVAVLHGVGGNFCAGLDLHELAQMEGNLEEIIRGEGTVGPTHRFIKKPIVAGVSGYAVGAGFELALMCDLRVVEENAVLGCFNRRFGVPLVDGGTVRLVSMVGLSRALEMILTGKAVTPDDLQKWGVANVVVKCGTGFGQALQIATSLIKFPQECLLADRRSCHNAAFSASFEKLVEYERNNGYPVFSKEAIEGARQFVSGIGRHGSSHNLKPKPLPDWEIEFNKQQQDT